MHYANHILYNEYIFSYLESVTGAEKLLQFSF